MPKKYHPTASIAWSCLKSLSQEQQPGIVELFNREPDRLAKYSINACGLYADFSKSAASQSVLDQLIDLANQSPLYQAIELLFSGEKLNLTENRPVLHMALRGSTAPELEIDGINVADFVAAEKDKMRRISDGIRTGSWCGVTGKPLRHIVNIGIGGSDLGPRMVCAALREYCHPDLSLHFLANVDGAEVSALMNELDAESTLIIIASKTFTTQETLLNASTLSNWLAESLGVERNQIGNHLIGITSAPQQAIDWGVSKDHLLTFKDWVGGRYSLWSSVGLPIAIAVGMGKFEELLQGAHAMDSHFRTAPWRQNLPVVSALLGIWNSNFLGAESQAIIPYCERLALLPAYLQQLDMESNGKSAQRDGSEVSFDTGAILWGQTGTNGQHAFFQLIHQGTHLIPVEFVALVEDSLSLPDHHRVLLANMVAQSMALMTGKANENRHRNYPGNKPTSTILLPKLNPYSLGALIAYHEHRVFAQGIIWNINSFDQWGVELGKQLTGKVLGADRDKFDPSTRELISRLGIDS